MPVSGVSNRTPRRVTGGEGTSTRITGGESVSVNVTPRTPTRVTGGESTSRTPTRVTGGESTSTSTSRTPSRVTGGEATQPLRIPVTVSAPAFNPFEAWARWTSAVWSFWTGGSSRRVSGTE